MGKRVAIFIVICFWTCLSAISVAAAWADQGRQSQDRVKSKPERHDQLHPARDSGKTLAARQICGDFSVTVVIERIVETLEVASVSDLGAATEVIEFREGTDQFVRKLPGLTSTQILVLKIAGATLPEGVLEWISDTQAGGADRRMVTVTFHDGRGDTHWNLLGCFPSRLSISSESGLPGAVLTRLEIACDHLAFSQY